jgi:hypothetical protein
MVSGGLHPELLKTGDLDVIPASLKASRGIKMKECGLSVNHLCL